MHCMCCMCCMHEELETIICVLNIPFFLLLLSAIEFYFAGYFLSVQRRLSELSDECRGKDDKICQLEAEIAQLTSKLSVNIISNLSSSNLSESMSQSLSQYASPTGTMRREHAIPGRTAPVKRQMEANKRKDSTGSISSDVASPRHQVSRTQYRDALQTTQGQHQPLHHRLSQDAAPMSPAHKLTSLSSAFGATNTDSLVSSSGRGTPPAATSSQQAVSSPFAGRMPSVVTSSSEYQHESSLTTQPGTPQSAARSSAVAQVKCDKIVLCLLHILSELMRSVLTGVLANDAH